jgi:hypothetical protein
LCAEAGQEAASTVLEMASIDEIYEVYPCKIGHENWNNHGGHEWKPITYTHIDYDWAYTDQYEPNEFLDWEFWTFPCRERCTVEGCNTERYLKEFFWLPDYINKEANAFSS